MNSRSRKKRALFLLSRHTKSASPSPKSTPIELILAPDLYLFKSEAIPVHSSYQAKKIAASLMEDLGSGEGWVYEAIYDSKEWHIFAYDPKELLESLQRAGIKARDVAKIYFAQQFSDQLTKPLLLDQHLLVSLNGIVTLLPLTHKQPPKDYLRLGSLKPPKKAFKLRGVKADTLLSSKDALLLSAALMMLALAWGVTGLKYSHAAKALESSLQEQLKKQPTLSSSIARKNILLHYRQIDRLQRQIRQSTLNIAQLTGKDSNLQSLRITQKGYEAIISAKANRLKTLLQLAHDAGLSAKLKGGRLKIEGVWR